MDNKETLQPGVMPKVDIEWKTLWQIYKLSKDVCECRGDLLENTVRDTLSEIKKLL